MTDMQREMITFIKGRGGAVRDIDLADRFGVLEDPNQVFPVWRAVDQSLREGLLERVSPDHPIRSGQLAVRLATDAIA